MNINQEIEILKALKQKAGNHSPSPKEIEGAIGFDPIKVDFCFLSNPYATELVISHYKNKLSEDRLFHLFESYPASSDYVARKIASFEGINADQVVVSNGAIQAIEWVCEYWNIGKLLIPTPTFSTYYEYLDEKYFLAESFWLSENLTAENLLGLAEDNNCDTILLINPNNPSGEVLSLNELDKLINNLGERKLIIDESFCHFLDDYYEYKDYRRNLENKSICFIKSMSKDFGVAGVRLGYIYSYDDNLLKNCRKKITWNLNNFAIAFSEILGDFMFQESYRKARREYLEARSDFYDGLCELGNVEVFPSQSNFFLIKLPENSDADIVQRLLLETGVYVRTMEDKIGLDQSYIRVACRRREENDYFLSTIINYV
ncbi:aminotransferase class I/II-fold pyridoxal phosphate-dependent enzyme [Porticoccaceae bacterium]|nr:aminotransferase class I/II-fold pyridoxal phosphate-dependent enzyme [Porticoccaceae bacterium]